MDVVRLKADTTYDPDSVTDVVRLKADTTYDPWQA